MKVGTEEDVTGLLRAWSRGEEDARESLAQLTYQDLKRIAAGFLRNEHQGHTLQPTALVHEAYMRLASQRTEWRDRRQFFAISSRLMRRILVDHARRQQFQKRGSGCSRLPLDEAREVTVERRPEEVLAVAEALEALAKEDRLKAEVVELRYFAGLTVEETATVLNRAPSTVYSLWKEAKQWLFGRLREAPP